MLHHFTAAITTAETAAKNRAAILRDFYDYRRTAVSEGETGPVREYLLVPGADPSRAERLARLLAAQGIEVSRADEPFRLGTRHAAGGHVDRRGGAAGRAAACATCSTRTTLQPEAFVKEQDRRRVKRLGDQIYDVTAWSLPLAFDVEVVTADRPTLAKATPMAQYLPPRSNDRAAPAAAAPAGAPPKVGFLLPWGSATAGFVAEALRAGDPPALGRSAVHARRPRLRRRHGAGPHRRERRRRCRRRSARLARTHGVELVRDRQRVRRGRHLARQRLDGRAQGAARADGVGHAGTQPCRPAGRATRSSAASASR